MPLTSSIFPSKAIAPEGRPHGSGYGQRRSGWKIEALRGMSEQTTF